MVAKVIPEMRWCLVCGKTFLVGGTGNKKRGTKTCSQKCNGQLKNAAKPGTHCHALAVVQAAYLAGMIDADGHIGLYRRSATQNLRVHVDVSNTDIALLEWIKQVTGIGSVNKQHAETEKHRASFQWNVANESAITLLEQLLPYMIVKRKRAEVAIEFFSKRQEASDRIDLSWQDVYRDKMLALNKRGPQEW